MDIKIIMIVGLIISVLLIPIFINTIDNAQEIVEQSNKMINSMDLIGTEFNLVLFDRSSVTGDTIKAAIDSGKNLSSGLHMLYTIENGSTVNKYGLLNSTEYKLIDNSFYNSGLKEKVFSTELKTNSNGIVTEIVFTKR